MSGPRAFIVEDSDVILQNLTEALEEVSDVVVVGTAADQQAALKWLTTETNGGCDVVIVDIFLRSGSGLGVLAGIQNFAPPPKRVVLSNYLTPAMRERCLELGVEAAFDKSNELDELLLWLKRAKAH